MKTLLLLLCLARLAMAQVTDAEASTLLETPVVNAASEYGGLTATLTAPHCFGDVCLPAGAKVSASLSGKTVTLTRAHSPKVFTAVGARFAAQSDFSISDGQIAEGTLAAVLTIDGFKVSGPVVLRLGEKPTLLEGTLVQPTKFHGWSVPAGFQVSQRVDDEWGAEATRAAARGAVMVRLAKEGAGPARARAVREAPLWNEFELVEPLRVGAVKFASGPFAVTFMPDGQRLYTGTLASPVEVGVVKVSAGAGVYWCDRDGLQEAQGGQDPFVPTKLFTLDSFTFAAAQVRVRRAGKPVAGHKAETCTSGDLTGYEVELSGQSCICGGPGIGRNPTLHLDAKGQVIGRSRTLREEVEKAQAPCQCRALPSGGPPPP